MQSKLWRFVIVAVVVGWAISEWYPPTSRDMLDVFEERANAKDETFAGILKQARDLKAGQGADLTFDQWEKVIGGTDLARYFTAPPGLKADSDTNRVILRNIERAASGEIQLGLDLKGGTQFVVELDLSKSKSGDTEGDVEQVMRVLRGRVDRFGVTEPEIQRMGESRISIQIPGLSQAKREEAKRNIQRAAFLQFHLVHPENDAIDNSMKDLYAGHTKLERTFRDQQGNENKEVVLVEDEVRMKGEHVARASANRDPTTGAPLIHFNLDNDGAKIFYQLTGAHLGRRLAVVLVDKVDKLQQQYFNTEAEAEAFYGTLGKIKQPRRPRAEGNRTVVEWYDQVDEKRLISAPTIQGRIGARGEITGIDSSTEAREIANVLANPLATPLRIVEERDIDPSLGQDSVRQGYQAGLWGIIAVAVFMVGYYMLSGIIANLALALNMVILLGVFCYFDSTLTLPGIAGIVLTIGMAVDANVLIFERIREEQRVGKSLKGAIASGYGKAFGTIFDANLTTVIASLILYYKGHGPVQGFGVTLTIGILTSMFTALVVTRLVYDLMVDRKWVQNHLKMNSIVPANTKINFLKFSNPAFYTSCVLIVGGIIFGIARGPETMLGIDFAGGKSFVIGYDDSKKNEMMEAVHSGEIRDKIADSVDGLEAAQIKVRLNSNMNPEPGDYREFVRVDFPDQQTEAEGSAIETEVQNALMNNYGEKMGLAEKRQSAETVGASISAEIQEAAIVATVLALLGILVYVAFRYEFSFAIGAILAIIHDVLMTAGLFFVAGGITGIDIASGELNTPIIAAFLAIIGFSINDTIVIFDRIRESLRLGMPGTFDDVMNHALNQTLARTVITSGTTLLTAATLYFFGGVVIHDFAFTLLVGVVVGTYSSIYIACAVVKLWHGGKRPEISVPVMDEETAPATT